MRTARHALVPLAALAVLSACSGGTDAPAPSPAPAQRSVAAPHADPGTSPTGTERTAPLDGGVLETGGPDEATAPVTLRETTALPGDPPEPPEELGREDAEGALAAARHAHALRNHLMTTGDPVPFSEMVGSTCSDCSSTLEWTSSLRQLASHLELDGEVETATPVVEELGAGWWRVDLRHKVRSARVVADDGSEAHPVLEDVDVRLASIYLLRDGDGWLVGEMVYKVLV